MWQFGSFFCFALIVFFPILFSRIPERKHRIVAFAPNVFGAHFRFEFAACTGNARCSIYMNIQLSGGSKTNIYDNEVFIMNEINHTMLIMSAQSVNRCMLRSAPSKAANKNRTKPEAHRVHTWCMQCAHRVHIRFYVQYVVLVLVLVVRARAARLMLIFCVINWSIH